MSTDSPPRPCGGPTLGMHRLGVAVVLACLACGPAPKAGEQEADPARPIASVPLTSIGGLPFVTVATDSGAARLWLLDSGFELSVVNRRVADSLFLPSLATRDQAAPGGHIPVGTAAGIPLHLGTSTFRPESLAVIDLRQIEPLVGGPIAGILGHDFLSRYVVRIDYDRGVVELFDPGTFAYGGTGRPMPVWIEDAQAFALGVLYLQGRAVPAKLKLDTGSLDALGLNGSFVRQTELAREGAPPLPALGAAIGGKVEGYVLRLDSVVMGGQVVERPVAAYAADLARGGDAGTIGVGILGRFNLVFDYARRRVILEPTPRLHAPSLYDASGLLLGAEGPQWREVTVLSVDAGSPAAAAEVRPGDVLVAIDGRPTTQLALSAVRERLAQPDTTVSLRFRRGSQERLVELRLAPRL